MKSGLISIIIPVYNAEKYLRECIDGILGQSYKNYELLLVNDGSTDGSATICDEYAKENSQIKVFHRENSGPSVTRNFGVDMAEGEYIVFIDADDVIDDNYLFALHDNLSRYGVDLVLCDYERFYKDDLEQKVHYGISRYSVAIAKSREELAKVYQNSSTNLFGISVWAKLYKSEIIKKHHIRFPEDISFEEDCCFNVQYFEYVNTAAFTRETVYHYRQIEKSLSKLYQTSTFRDLINGYNKRKEFVSKIGMEQEDVKKLDNIFLVATINNYKKIAMSDMSIKEKKKAYKETLDYPEVKNVFKSTNLSPVRLTRWVTKASRKENIGMILLLMEIWNLKKKIRG